MSYQRHRIEKNVCSSTRCPENKMVKLARLYLEIHDKRHINCCTFRFSYSDTLKDGCQRFQIPSPCSYDREEHSPCDISHRRTGWEGSMPWPPTSPDLTPLDFFFHVYMKTTRNLALLKEKIRARNKKYATASKAQAEYRLAIRRAMNRRTCGNLLGYVTDYYTYPLISRFKFLQ